MGAPGTLGPVSASGPDAAVVAIAEALGLPGDSSPQTVLAQVRRLVRVRRERDELLRAALAAARSTASASDMQVLSEVARRLDLSID